MNVQKHVEDQLNNFEKCLELLTLIQVHDDVTDSKHSEDLEQTQKLEDSNLVVWKEFI